METISKSQLVAILNKHQLAPRKRLGQNFLVDGNIIKKIIALINPDEVVVEIGSGLGALTLPAAEKANRIIAFEKDIKIASAFEKEFLTKNNNILLIKEDILSSSDLLPNEDYIVLSNLPFYITSVVIRFFLENSRPPQKMILMMQKEVAQRICSRPPRMSLLAISVQFYARPKIIFNVSRRSFWPSPAVDCSVIILEKKRESMDFVNSKRFFSIVKAGFSRPRAQLLNNLSKKLKLNKEDVKKQMLAVNLSPQRRAESLTLEEWLILIEGLKKMLL